jgi:hypothetical protein
LKGGEEKWHEEIKTKTKVEVGTATPKNTPKSVAKVVKAKVNKTTQAISPMTARRPVKPAEKVDLNNFTQRKNQTKQALYRVCFI